MPSGRRKKPANYEEEIALLDEQIEEQAQKLKELKDKKKARVKEEEKLKDATKWDQLRNSGLSVDDLLNFASKKK